MPSQKSKQHHQTDACKTALIFILANGLTNGGVTTWAINAIRRLSTRNDYNCAIIAHTPEAGAEEFSRSCSDRIIDCPGNASGHLPNTQAINRFANCYSSLGDAILIPNWSWGTWAAVAALLRRPEHRLHAIGIAHTDDKSYYDLMVHYEPIISKYIAVSDHIYRQLVRKIPSRQQDIIRLPCPTDLSPYRVRSTKPLNRLKIGYAGRIQDYQKRILDLPKLVADLASRRGNYCFEIAGDGTHLAELREFFAENQFPNVKVHFHGLVNPDAIASLWASVDVGILFSSHEGLSISMIESMAAGCVQVVTDVSGVTDSVSHGLTGFIHTIGDTAAMADSLQTLLEQPELLSQMSTRCIEHAHLNHNPEQYDRQLVELVQQAWQQPQRHWPRFRRLIPASVVATQRARLKKTASISIQGRIKLKCIGLMKSLGLRLGFIDSQDL
jgi:glycosyltransferase involved in cell wall biosynthesis